MRIRRPIGISATFLAAVALIAGLAVMLVGFFWLTEEYARFHRESQALRQEYIENQKAKIRDEVEKALDYVQYRHLRSETILRAALKHRVDEAHAIASRLVEIGGFAADPSGTGALGEGSLAPDPVQQRARAISSSPACKASRVLYPVAPQFEGTNLLGLKDAKGNFVIRDEIQLLKKQTEGFVFDHWRKPDSPASGRTQMIHPKITFIKRFEPFGVVPRHRGIPGRFRAGPPGGAAGAHRPDPLRQGRLCLREHLRWDPPHHRRPASEATQEPVGC